MTAVQEPELWGDPPLRRAVDERLSCGSSFQLAFLDHSVNRKPRHGRKPTADRLIAPISGVQNEPEQLAKSLFSRKSLAFLKISCRNPFTPAIRQRYDVDRQFAGTL